MNDKKIEEKAKIYAIAATCNTCSEYLENGDECPRKFPCDSHNKAKEGFDDGNQLPIDTLTQHKEALRELVDKSYGLFIQTRSSTQLDYYTQFDEVRTKAEQLLNNE